MIELKIKFGVSRFDSSWDNKEYQQEFADGFNHALVSIGDISVAFENNVLVRQYAGFDEFADIATISIPCDDYVKIFEAITKKEGMDTARKLIYSALQESKKLAIQKSERQVQRDRLSSLLEGAVFKELRDGDIVLALPDGGEVVISTEYDP